MPKTESIFTGNARGYSPPELASGPLKSIVGALLSCPAAAASPSRVTVGFAQDVLTSTFATGRGGS
ncbi:hypothetical protein [Cytobacillus firmus]|uniref:hypothetical protein n=1 Tax=Cytobacillus firmus TaxID=1399 RepID=UPI0022281F00|nr:hypothetical protein [Cytobacillus firmus]